MMPFDRLYNLMVAEEESHFYSSPLQSHSESDALLPPFYDSDESFNAFSNNLSSALLPLSCYHEPRFDDIDLDSLTWDDNNLKITKANHDSSAFNFPLISTTVVDVPCSDEEKIAKNLVTGSKANLNELGFDEISKYFCMTITQAAKEMNVGLTMLKKRCRELGIGRWPHRKLKSLDSLINNLKEFGIDGENEIVMLELKVLEEQKRLMEENPRMELNEWIKKKRQACFKANYKRRKGFQ